MDGRVDVSLGNFRVGRLHVDPALVRGEGGCLSPVLLVPASLHLDPREEKQMIAVTELEADLVLPARGEVALGAVISVPARVSSLNLRGGIWVSILGARSNIGSSSASPSPSSRLGCFRNTRSALATRRSPLVYICASLRPGCVRAATPHDPAPPTIRFPPRPA